MKKLALILVVTSIALPVAARTLITEYRSDLLCFFDERGDEGLAIDHTSHLDVRFVEQPYVKYALVNCSKSETSADLLQIECQWPQNGSPIELKLDLRNNKGIAEMGTQNRNIKQMTFTCQNNLQQGT